MHLYKILAGLERKATSILVGVTRGAGKSRACEMAGRIYKRCFPNATKRNNA